MAVSALHATEEHGKFIFGRNARRTGWNSGGGHLFVNSFVFPSLEMRNA